MGKKKAKNLSRSRPSSARFRRTKSDYMGTEQESNTGTYKVDNAFAKIKSKLVCVMLVL